MIQSKFMEISLRSSRYYLWRLLFLGKYENDPDVSAEIEKHVSFLHYPLIMEFFNAFSYLKAGEDVRTHLENLRIMTNGVKAQS